MLGDLNTNSIIESTPRAPMEFIYANSFQNQMNELLVLCKNQDKEYEATVYTL